MWVANESPPVSHDTFVSFKLILTSCVIKIKAKGSPSSSCALSLHGYRENTVITKKKTRLLLSMLNDVRLKTFFIRPLHKLSVDRERFLPFPKKAFFVQQFA